MPMHDGSPGLCHIADILIERDSSAKVSKQINCGAIPKWPKGTVCKTVFHGFESHSHLAEAPCIVQGAFYISYSEERRCSLDLAGSFSLKGKSGVQGWGINGFLEFLYNPEAGEYHNHVLHIRE